MKGEEMQKNRIRTTNKNQMAGRQSKFNPLAINYAPRHMAGCRKNGKR
jgi:hypothetical protein